MHNYVIIVIVFVCKIVIKPLFPLTPHHIWLALILIKMTLLPLWSSAVDHFQDDFDLSGTMVLAGIATTAAYKYRYIINWYSIFKLYIIVFTYFSWLSQNFWMVSQEYLGAPIYWSPKILFSIFWKGMKRKSYDKTRFCVSHEGLSNGLGTFGLTWYMFENKTKNMFLIWRGSNILEPRLQYNGARAPIYWSPSNICLTK